MVTKENDKTKKQAFERKTEEEEKESKLLTKTHFSGETMIQRKKAEK